jgi:hypothetical protein
MANQLTRLEMRRVACCHHPQLHQHHPCVHKRGAHPTGSELQLAHGVEMVRITAATTSDVAFADGVSFCLPWSFPCRCTPALSWRGSTLATACTSVSPDC